MNEAQPMTTGGCQCGAVRYAFKGKMIDPSICHCRMCQKAFGSYFEPLGGVKDADLVWTRGKPSVFKSSSVVERGFCQACGTPLTFKYHHEDITDLALGSLDHPKEVIPVIAFGTEAEMPWFDWLAGLPAKPTAASTPANLLDAIKSYQHPDHDTKTWDAKSSE